jgi:hypothetical protein
VHTAERGGARQDGACSTAVVVSWRAPPSSRQGACALQ